MPAAEKKKTPSQLDLLLASNPLLKKEFERRIKNARIQAAALAEESKEILRKHLVELERLLEKNQRRERELLDSLKLKEVSVAAGNGNPELGELRIENTRLKAEVENLELTLRDLHRSYAKLLNDRSKSAR